MGCPVTVRSFEEAGNTFFDSADMEAGGILDRLRAGANEFAA
jgi:hypothetical protein